MEEKIVIKGARTHNLKNISVEMPRNKMIVFTGLSGSGKSSLAFDTIFAEGQRRYVESLSAYARQFLQQFQKPDVDDITGLSPAISIDQKTRSSNPRSTVATMTEIYDYLRVLYARVGKPHCLICGRQIERLSKEEITNFINARIERERKDDPSTFVHVLAPVVRGRKGEYYQLLYNFLSKGYSSVLVDGSIHSLRDRIILDKNKKHNIDILVDSLAVDAFFAVNKEPYDRLTEAVERAIDESEGLVKIEFCDKKRTHCESFLMSTVHACPEDGFSYPEVEPRLFSFNSPYGACPTCNGLGTKHLFGDEVCESCEGARLRKEALLVKIGNLGDDLLKTGKNIVEFTQMTIRDAHEFITNILFSERDEDIAEGILKEIEGRLKFMLNVGLDYLTLDRRANTLSGGESQRIRLASQLGSRLVGALYVLDEPTIGLHMRDNDRLIKTLTKLRDLGNTIIVVEHDEDTIYSSDYIVDLGPGAGVHGGEIVVSGYLEKLLTAKKNDSGSRTLSYLRKEEEIPVPSERRTNDKGWIKIRGATVHNIKNQNFDIPLGKLTVITGVSGSGKSTLLYDLLEINLNARYDRRHKSPEIYNCNSFTGTEYASRAVMIDQSPIGRTPRSNPATYTGAWTHIRDMFAMTPEARLRGWKSGRFSFNVRGGRCEVCEGNGFIAVEMHFLPTTYVPCDTCRGKRFEKSTLEVEYRGKNIYDVLKMTIEEAQVFFKDIPAISDRLNELVDTGLGYLELGQPATTLSGGEAQRVKIASELYRPDTHRTVYLLDEPTVGLHYDDVAKLLEILQTLVRRGNSVILIEHNMDVIKSCDYVLDMGPNGGNGGGRLIAKGTPEEVARSKDSFTAEYLRKILQ